MKVLIIGGGLSGLALAERLEEKGHDYMLVEARSRFGGRIKTEYYGGGYFDLGPAWFWLGQPRIAALARRLGLKVFDQYSDGIQTFEDEHGNVQHGRNFGLMQESWRLKDGLGALTHALANRLPDTRKRLDAAVIALTQNGFGITATLRNGDRLTADKAILALPPRIAAEMNFMPNLPSSAIKSMQTIPTWMASQAKAVAIYDKPFWREAGLSGDAMSRFGPMVEIHDASPLEGGPYALFGFIGIPSDARTETQWLRRQLRAQLGRLFGAEAAEPLKLYVKDWAFDPYTSTKADKTPNSVHLTHNLAHEMTNLWNNMLHFSGTEVAPQFGGYIEGALEASENILRTIEF